MKSRSICHGIESDSASPHCTSTCRIVTSLLTERSGTSQRTMEIVTNHGMPVRWSTAHYRFSRAPCTATLYRRPSLARSFTSFRLCSSQSTSLALSPKFPSLFYQPPFLRALSLTLCHGRSFPFVRLSLLTRAYSSSRVLRPNGEIAVLYPSLFLIYHPPPGTITELSRSIYCCCPPLPPPTFSPQLLSHPLILSRSTSQRYSSSPFPFDLSSSSFSQYDSSVPPIERSSNSTTYRQIKFVLARRARHI